MPVFAGIAQGIGESIAAGDDDFEERRRSIVSDFGEGVRTNTHWGFNELKNYRDSLANGNADLLSLLPTDDSLQTIADRNSKALRHTEFTQSNERAGYNRKKLDELYGSIISNAASQPGDYPTNESLQDDLLAARQRWLKTRGIELEENTWLRPTDKSAESLYALINTTTKNLRESARGKAREGWATLREGYLQDQAMTAERMKGLQGQYRTGFGSILQDDFWSTIFRDQDSIQGELSRRDQLKNMEIETAQAQLTQSQRALAQEFNTAFNSNLILSGDKDKALSETYAQLGVQEGDFKNLMDAKYAEVDVQPRLEDAARNAWNKYGGDINTEMGRTDEVMTAKQISAMTGIPETSPIIQLVVDRATAALTKSLDDRRSTSSKAIKDDMLTEKRMSFWLGRDISDEERWQAFLGLADDAKYPGLAELKKTPNHDLMWDIINQGAKENFTYSKSGFAALQRAAIKKHVGDLEGEFAGKDYADKVGGTLRMEDWPVDKDMKLADDTNFTAESFVDAARNAVLQLYLQGDKNYRYDPQSSSDFMSAAMSAILSHSKELSAPGMNNLDIQSWLRSNASSIFTAYSREHGISSPLTQKDYVDQTAMDLAGAEVGPAYVTEEAFLEDSNERVKEAENLAAVVKQHVENREHRQAGTMSLHEWNQSQLAIDDRAAIAGIKKQIAFLSKQAEMYEANPSRMLYGNVQDRANLQANVEKLQGLLKEVMDVDYNLEDSYEVDPDGNEAQTTTSSATTSNIEATLITPWVAMGLNEDDGGWVRIRAARGPGSVIADGAVRGEDIGKNAGSFYKWKVKDQDEFEDDERFGSRVSGTGRLAGTSRWVWNDAGRALGFK